ncbi:hypothetical protein ABZ356_02650 [Micromonospora zamorensis]|uniref:hypothetical protein n=1 Tax=Micromonospora zamorensis TaxID=709883 RepID=UPI00340E6936
MTLAGVSVVATSAPAYASWYQAKVGDSGVNVRDCYHPKSLPPSTTGCKAIKFLPKDTPVYIVCQFPGGEMIYNDPVWDYVVFAGGEGFAADYYINTRTPVPWLGIDTCQ